MKLNWILINLKFWPWIQIENMKATKDKTWNNNQIDTEHNKQTNKKSEFKHLKIFIGVHTFIEPQSKTCIQYKIYET